jgi:sugar phosphate isomerase/epimerase
VHRTFVDNLRYAAAALKKAGLALLVEPINTYDIPGFHLHGTQQALDILDEVGSDNVFVQYDIYHMQRMEGELAATLERCLPRIGHVQLADNPGRHEPGTGKSTTTSCSPTWTASATAAGSAANTSRRPARKPVLAGCAAPQPDRFISSTRSTE